MEELSDVDATRLYAAMERDLTWIAQTRGRIDNTFVQRTLRNNVRSLKLLSDENEILLDRVLDAHVTNESQPLKPLELLQALRVCGA